MGGLGGAGTSPNFLCPVELDNVCYMKGTIKRQKSTLRFCGPEDVFCLLKRSREDRSTYGTSTSIGAASSTDHQFDSELSAGSDDDDVSHQCLTLAVINVQQL